MTKRLSALCLILVTVSLPAWAVDCPKLLVEGQGSVAERTTVSTQSYLNMIQSLVARGLLGPDGIEKILASKTPPNPADSEYLDYPTSATQLFALRRGFDQILQRELDWDLVKRELSNIIEGQKDQREERAVARDLSKEVFAFVKLHTYFEHHDRIHYITKTWAYRAKDGTEYLAYVLDTQHSDSKWLVLANLTNRTTERITAIDERYSIDPFLELPSGKLLVAASSDGMIKFFDAKTAKLAFSPRISGTALNLSAYADKQDRPYLVGAFERRWFLFGRRKHAIRRVDVDGINDKFVGAISADVKKTSFYLSPDGQPYLLWSKRSKKILDPAVIFVQNTTPGGPRTVSIEVPSHLLRLNPLENVSMYTDTSGKTRVALRGQSETLIYDPSNGKELAKYVTPRYGTAKAMLGYVTDATGRGWLVLGTANNKLPFLDTLTGDLRSIDIGMRPNPSNATIEVIKKRSGELLIAFYYSHVVTGIDMEDSITLIDFATEKPVSLMGEGHGKLHHIYETADGRIEAAFSDSGALKLYQIYGDLSKLR